LGSPPAYPPCPTHFRSSFGPGARDGFRHGACGPAVLSPRLTGMGSVRSTNITTHSCHYARLHSTPATAAHQTPRQEKGLGSPRVPFQSSRTNTHTHIQCTDTRTRHVLAPIFYPALLHLAAGDVPCACLTEHVVRVPSAYLDILLPTLGGGEGKRGYLAR
jgi:hypothetical protein